MIDAHLRHVLSAFKELAGEIGKMEASGRGGLRDCKGEIAVTEVSYDNWLYAIAYRGKPAYTGTATPSRGYKKKLRLAYRKLWRARKKVAHNEGHGGLRTD